MIKTYLRGGVALAAMTLALELASASDANAQVLSAPPPTRYTVDERGVDVRLGTYNRSTTDVVIGQPGQGGLTYERTFAGSGWRDNLTTTIVVVSGQTIVSAGGYSEAFTLSGSTYSPVIPRGSRLVKTGTDFTWTWSDGTVVQFSGDFNEFYGPGNGGSLGRAISVTKPNGEVIEYAYQTVELEGSGLPNKAVRLTGATNNYGYGLKVEYALAPEPTSNTQFALWTQIRKVTGYNFTIDYCAPAVTSCTFTGTWPSASYAQNSTSSTVTDTLGHVTTYTYNGSGQMTGVKLPDSTLNQLTMIYSGGRVSAVNVGGDSDVWDYTYSDASGTRTTTITDPLNHAWVARSNIAAGTLTSWTDPLNNTTSYGYNAGRVSSITLPEGNSVSYVYDGRGNVTQTTATPKAGSGQSAIVTSATYQSGCTNPIVCNSPTSTTDGRGATTNYSWDATHGGLTAVTLPAPTTGAVRPRTRITYDDRTAHYKNINGNIVNAPSSVTLPTNVSQCITNSSCDGTADETETNLVYGSATSTVANNLLPTSVTNRAGNGAVSSTITIGYDRNGDATQIDGPVSGMTRRNRYDVGRRQIGIVGPDPDGAGPLTYRAIRYTYDDRNQVTLTEAGTVAGYGDGSWANFAPLQRVATQYDNIGRSIWTRLQVGSTTYSSAQTRYDAAGRVACSITRMTSLNTLLSSCTPGSGSAGYDRVTRYTYDNANRALSQTRAYGTSDAATEAFTWTDNGQVLTARDGANHTSTFEYDGFDRLSRLRYPNASGSGSSTTDDEFYTYDANSNLVDWVNRAGTTFGLTYDALDQLTLLDPNIAGTGDVDYTYDNLGRVTSAYSSVNNSIMRAYDQLGRLLSETTQQGQMSYQYDAAGNRTRITWPDAFYVTYAYSDYGQIETITQGASNILATYAYDNLGRRATITRPAKPNTAYSYTGPRLTSIFQDLSGSGDDVTLAFQYNPAGQITQRTVSNDKYVWNEANEGTTNYTNNGRNQVTNAGGTTISYGAEPNNGNITSVGTTNYAYDALNRMTAGAGVAMTYDPDSRLRTSGGNAYGYIGGQIAAVYAGTNLSERYVPGPGIDETVAYFDAAGNQRMVFADERSSTIGYTNTSGYAVVFNTYDEYGVAGAGNGFGMQYTGQFSLPNAGGYYYKTRVYNPNLGRFMQPDTIRYEAGLNIYNYVFGDPLNLADSWGLDPFCVSHATTEEGPDGTVVVVGHRTTCPVTFGRWPQIDGLGGGFLWWRLARPALEVVDPFVTPIVAEAVCNLPTVSVGPGADAYAGLGVSVSGSVNADIANGRFGLGLQVGAGAGAGFNAGGQAGISPSGGGIVSANAGWSAGLAGWVVPGVAVGGAYSRNVIGTNPGESAAAVGRAGTPMAYANIQANAALMTPSLYDLPCEKQ